jgi:L-arabinose isomerase
VEPLLPRIGIAVIASPYEVGVENVKTVYDEASKGLTKAGLKISAPDVIVDTDEKGVEVGQMFNRDGVDAICLLYGTYADDTFATSVLEQSNLPAIVWGTNLYDTGSIAGAQQLSAVLQEVGRYFRPVFGNVDDRRAISEVAGAARVAAAKKRLAHSRIGVIGYPRIKGQTQASFDEIELHSKTGVRIVGVGTHLFIDYQSKISKEEIMDVWRGASSGVGKISVNEDQIAEGVRAYLSMKKIVREKRLDAVCLEDWNDFIGVPNLAFSLLNEEGTPAACESDVHSALTLYLLSLLTGKASFHGELLGILEEEDALLVAHYGAGAPSLASSRQGIRLEPDRSSKRGVSVVFNFRPGPVTVASLTGRRGTYRMLIAPGESIRSKEVFHGGIVANIRFSVGWRDMLKRASGMSHHWIIGQGDVLGELKDYCEMSEIRPVLV